MHMPLAVRTYFEADRARDAEALGAFAADAIVADEGASRSGHGEIRAWWLAAKRNYDHQAEPFEATSRGDGVTVRAKVTGRFANSPATLRYDFRVADGKIARLEIR